MLEGIIAKVQQVLNRVGQSTDTANASGNLHQKVSDVKGSVGNIGDAASSTGTLHSKSLDLRNQTGASSDAASSTGSLHAKIADIRNNMTVANNGSVIKSVQRGTTAAAGSITITAINTAKAFVRSSSKGSAGTVAATGSISLNAGGTTSFTGGSQGNSNTTGNQVYNFPSYSGSITGGTTNLTVQVYSAKIVNSTTLSCDGPVEWEVVEYV